MHLISTFVYFVVPYLQTKEEQPKHQLPQAGEGSRGEEVSFLCQLGLVGRTGTWRWRDDEMLVQQMWWFDGWMGGWLETFKVLLVTIVLLAKSSDLVKVFGWLEVDRWEALGCDCLVLCPASPHHASQPSSPTMPPQSPHPALASQPPPNPLQASRPPLPSWNGFSWTKQQDI